MLPLTLGAAAGLAVLAAVLALYIEGDTQAGSYVLVIALGLTTLTIPVLMITQKSWLLAPQFALLGIGALWMPDGGKPDWSVWVLAGVGTLLAGQLFLLFLTGSWWSPLAYAVVGAGLLVLGGWLSGPLGTGQEHFVAMLNPERVTVSEPWWLLLLLLIPWLIWTSYRSLAGLGPVRATVAIGLRAALVLLLTLALANLQLKRIDETVTVIFLWDCSESVPQKFARGDDPQIERADRLIKFINQAVANRGTGRQRDRAGLILFGRWPLAFLPPANVPYFSLTKDQLKDAPIDGKRTDIAAALKLALASFPGGTARRIVLLSDGNENLGRAEEQALIFKNNRVQIDVVPLGAGEQNPNEVLIERVDPSTENEKGIKRTLYVTLRSYNPDTVVGELQVYKTSLTKFKDPETGQEQQLLTTTKLFADRNEDRPKLVRLKPGVTEIALRGVIDPEEGSSTFEAVFRPRRVEDAQGKVLSEGLPGDRVENNRASTSVVVRGKSRVLLIENGIEDEKTGQHRVGEHKLLVDRLRQANKERELIVMTADQVPQDLGKLLLLLSNVDCVILANVPAEKLSEAQQEVLRSNTHDQGCGMVVIGGKHAYGAGGWQNSKLEKAWPVVCDLKSLKVEGKGGLVLVMHASEIAEGNMWQKKIARLAVEKLSAVDMVGMVYYDFARGPRWHIPFQQVGPNRGRLLNLVDTMNPGDMPDAEPHLKMAYDELSDRRHGLGTKHIIFISDGDHWQPPVQLINKIKAAKISLTAICITSHGQAAVDKMKSIPAASYLPGKASKFYYVTDPKQLPAIYIKESRIVSQSFIHDKPFQPQVTAAGRATRPTNNLPEPLPKLQGFVRTTPRDSKLVEVTIVTPKLGDLQFPILAQWQYGLGTVLAFTSDAQTREKGPVGWDRDWASDKMYKQFWDQVVKYALRREEQGGMLRVVPETRDNRTVLVVYARDDKEPLVDLKVTARVTATRLKDNQDRELEFRQRKPGEYEAEMRAEEVGAYFLNVRATRRVGDKEVLVGSVRTVVTVPYSPEFGEMRANPELLEALRRITGGKAYGEAEDTLTAAVKAQRNLPRGARGKFEFTIDLVLAAGAGGHRPVLRRGGAAHRHRAGEVVGGAAGLLGPPGRAAGVGTGGGGGAPAGAAGGRGGAPLRGDRRCAASGCAQRHRGLADAPGSAAARAQGPGVAPEAPQEAGDAMSRLMRAKKRALQDRDKDKDKKD